MRRFQSIILMLLAVVMTTTGFSCNFVTPAEQVLLQPIKLTWWGVNDDPENFAEVIAEYRKIHPNVTVTYRKLRFEEYEAALLNALAEDRGPDIISVNNADMGRWLSKLEPLPASTKMAYQTTQVSMGIKQEVIVEVRETPSITTGRIKEVFADVVYTDAVFDNQIFGLPQSIDTLALYYNRDLFNTAGIPLPPTTWTEVQQAVKRLTYQDTTGTLTQSGIAIGTADNVDRAVDALSLLMLQNRAVMTVGRTVMFHQIPPGGSREYVPGPDAVRFYTDFANPVKEVFTWNAQQPNSLDAFAQGKAAMMLGYSYHQPLIEARRQSQLNYGVTKAPQIEGNQEVNFANYWLNTVSKKSKYINESWDFVQFIARSEQAQKYLDKTQRPAALRGLLSQQQEDDSLGVFAEQVLTAKSWYHGNDRSVMENAFKEMINAVLVTGIDPAKAAALAAQKIQQTL